MTSPAAMPTGVGQDFEASWIERRRSGLELGQHPAKEKRWGLALSGGGIRSATFALGVLQGLARATRADTSRSGSDGALLRYFDYVSTVSGGGYAGGFFCSLFVPKRMPVPEAAPSPERAAAEVAYRTLLHDPPGRMRARDVPDPTAPGKIPLAWLRENGRYLTPTGGGDLFYAAALAIRNWLSLHFVIGTVILTALALVALGRASLSFVDAYAVIEASLLNPLACSPCTIADYVWWSPLKYLPLLAVAFLVVPAGIAYWMNVPLPGQTPSDPVRRITVASIAAALASVVFAEAAIVIHPESEWREIGRASVWAAIVCLLGCLIHGFTARPTRTIAAQRVVMTRLFAATLHLTLLLAFVAVVDMLGQTVYRLLSHTGSPLWQALTPAGVLAAFVWAMRKSARFFDDKPTGLLSRLPVEWLALAAGGAMLLVTALIWQLVIHWVQWHGGPPANPGVPDGTRVLALAVLFATAFALAGATGYFAGFINTSSLHSFYSARLARAYLGASNGERFSSPEKQASVAEPHPNDDLTLDDYYGPKVLAPLHLINVTLNQTTDRAEQLVQRDRKGKPLVVTAGGFSIDGVHHFFRDAAEIKSEVQVPLSIGRWIGTSGAAFTTGLGRATSLGTSIALGLANVRLGIWWDSGQGDVQPSRTLFKAQRYLCDELTATFHGQRRAWQYLSDGGHFENTAIYELLRPERRVQLIVACDNGCDPTYGFEDLGNLVRLARIDHRLEIEVDVNIASDAVLKKAFGEPKDFDAKDGVPGKCAMLLACHATGPDGMREASPCAVIVLLKPTRLPDMAPDVADYARRHPAFPQEPTSDQFFDEAQWESYRKLGLSVAMKVFGVAPGVGPELWKYLRKTYQIQGLPEDGAGDTRAHDMKGSVPTSTS